MITHTSRNIASVAIVATLLLSGVTAASLLRRGLNQEEENSLLLLQDLNRTEEDVNHFNENCSFPCSDAEFCGLDGQCHAYSCEAWYTLGPPFFTRYQEGASGDLMCHTAATSNNNGADRTFLGQSPVCGDDWPVAVEFLTEGNNVSRQCPVDNVPSMPYLRKCTARPTPDTALVCYDMGGVAVAVSASGNTDTAATETETATTRQFDNENDSLRPYLAEIDGMAGRHVYSLYVSAPSYGYFLPLGESNSTELNTTALQSSMYSSLTTSQPEEERPFGYCEPGGCRIEEFCGRDKVCHSIDCDNLYRYGPVSMAGEQEDPDSDPQVECTLHEEFIGSNDTSTNTPCEDDEWPIALEYRCSPFNIWSSSSALCPKYSNSDGRLLSFARRCVGQPNPDQTFVCYDMKGVSLPDYTADYVDIVANNPNCTTNNLEPYLLDEENKNWPMCPTDSPSCITARHQMTNQVKNQSYGTNLYWHDMSEDAFLHDLNLEALDHALYSQLIGARLSGSTPESNSRGKLGLASSVMVVTVVYFVANVW